MELPDCFPGPLWVELLGKGCLLLSVIGNWAGLFLRFLCGPSRLGLVANLLPGVKSMGIGQLGCFWSNGKVAEVHD